MSVLSPVRRFIPCSTLLFLLVYPGCGETELDCASIGYVERDRTCVEPEADGANGGPLSERCAALDCEHRCDDTDPDEAVCTCPEGESLRADGRRCAPGDGPEQEGERGPDADGDGTPDDEDNCPTTANAAQRDLDGDGLGDACDPDEDGDGVTNADDTCRDAERQDWDGDGVPDACDPDDDDDGLLDADDPCPLGTVGAPDLDADGCSDADDEDDDGDGLADAEDGCPAVAASPQDDLDGDGCPLGWDACPLGLARGADGDDDGCKNEEDVAPGDAARPAPPRVVHVRAGWDAPEPATGDDWEHAFAHLQDGLARAGSLVLEAPSSSVHVWVSTGRYFPDRGEDQDPGDFDESFELRDGVELYGGFRWDEDGARWLRDDLGGSILDGDLLQDDAASPPDTSGDYTKDNTCHVVRDETEAGTAVIDGFSISHGVGGCGAADMGGGVLSEGTATFRNLRIEGNTAGSGGGVAVTGASTWVRVLVSDNLGGLGGGMYVEGPANATFYGVEIVGNVATEGGGLAQAGGSLVFVNGIVAGNRAVDGPGGFDGGSGSQLRALHVTFAGNSSVGASGFDAGNGYYVELNNSIVLDSTDPDDLGTSPPTIGDAELADVTAADLVDVPNVHAATTEGDLHLRTDVADNPAVDRGDADHLLCTGTLAELFVPGQGLACDAEGRLRFDLDGNPRVQGAAPDVGAYETAP